MLDRHRSTRRRVALVTSEALADLYEDDRLLVTALADLGIASVPAIWSDPRVDWTAFDALVIRTPWDYFERAAEFRVWLDARRAERVLLCNSHAVLDWNFDKGYLQGLARAGVAIVPTVFIARGENADIAALARGHGWDDVVVKPTIGGGAHGIRRLRVAELDDHAADIATMLEDRGVLVQPFLPEVQSDGELSLLFFDGVFSHAVRKRPKTGDYRVQFHLGGTHENAVVSDALVEQARACVAHAPEPTVYARVDGVVRDGRFLLMELEIFEPLMFLARHPEAPARFARAIEKRLLAST